MKTALFLLTISFISRIALADIIVGGTYSGSETIFGTIIIHCSESSGVCATVKTKIAGRAHDVIIPGVHGGVERFSCTSFFIDNKIVNGKEVKELQLFDAQPMKP